MKKLIISLAGILLGVAVLVGGLAMLRRSYSRPSVILTSTCDAPCWYGITPGQTGSWEIFDSLYEIEGISEVNVQYDRSEKLESYNWYFERPVDDSGGSVWFDGERVTAINILTINSMDLEEFFEKFGEPECYWKKLRRGDQREYIDLYLLYPSKVYMAEVLLDTKYGSDMVKTKPGTGIFRVVYFEPQMFYTLMGTKILFDIPVDPYTVGLEEWTGYGEIQFTRE